MFHSEQGILQRGRGGFNVDRHHFQRGRGLGGIFANIFRRMIPFSKSFARGAVDTGRHFIQSEQGKELVNDVIASTARAAKTALIDQNPEDAKRDMKESLKRTGKKSGRVIKKIAQDKLEKVLTGRGRKRVGKKRVKKSKRKKMTLLDK